MKESCECCLSAPAFLALEYSTSCDKGCWQQLTNIGNMPKKPLRWAVSRTASENTAPVPFESAYAIWTSWQHSCDRDDQALMQRGDRVGNVTLGPDRRRRGVGNYREWQVFCVSQRNEVLRGESSPVRRSGTRRLRCKVCRDDGSPATRGPRSARGRLLACAPGNRARPATAFLRDRPERGMKCSFRQWRANTSWAAALQRAIRSTVFLRLVSRRL